MVYTGQGDGELAREMLCRVNGNEDEGRGWVRGEGELGEEGRGGRRVEGK